MSASRDVTGARALLWRAKEGALAVREPFELPRGLECADSAMCLDL